MPTNNGTYTLPSVYHAVPGTTIEAIQHNAPLEDLAIAMNGTVSRDGSRPFTGNLPMGGRKVTGLGAGTNASDAVRFDQLPAGITGWLASVSALAMAANQIPYATGATTAAVTGLTAFGRSVIGAADAAAGRTAIGLGALSTKDKAAVADINATGTPSSTTFLRGDGSWQPLSAPTPTNIQFSQLGTWYVTGNSVGTYVMAQQQSGPASGYGDVVAASALREAPASGSVTAGFISGGSWRCMGRTAGSDSTSPNSTATTLWIRFL